MKKLFWTTGTGSVAISWILVWVCFMAIGPWLNAAELKKARVTQVIKDVKLLSGRAAPRAAAVSEDVRQGTAVRTGVESRAELTFTDLTITRLGANTIFSFNEGTRELNLGSGAILVSAPKDAPAIQIATPAFTGGVTGGTAILEFNKGAPSKFLILEGRGRFCPKANPNGCVDVPKGQMVVMTADGRVIGPFEFNAGLVYESSLLITDFPPLPNAYLIQETIAEQQNDQAGRPPNPFAPDLIDIVDQRFAASPASTATPTPTPPPPPTPPPTPSKFGPPSVISSPVPYVITNGTVITTDPSITTNGVTDLGKVWRGPAIDGPLSAFIFGSTSAFDTAIGFDAGAEKIVDSGAVFKFTSLELAGNPTVSTTNGQINLALVGVNGITSGRPGGTLTFAGISALLLATQDGSINLGTGIFFSGFHDLIFYARGTGSNLRLASAISDTIKLRLFAEGSIQVSSVDATLSAERVRLFAGDSITLDGGVMSATAANSGGNVDIFAENQISITNGLEIDRTFGGQSSGLNVSLSAGADFTVGNGLTILVDNSVSGNLDSGANITLNAGGNLTVNGDGGLSLTVANNDGGHIGIGGSISVTTGVNLTAGSLIALINDRHAGSIGGDSTLRLSVGGALTISNNVSVGISTRNDGTGGGTIGSNAAVDISAASVSVGGGFITFVSTAGGGSITGNASNTVNVTGDLVVQGPVLVTIEVPGFNQINPIIFIAGGHIGGDATVTLSAQNITTFSTASGIPGSDIMALEASIYPNGSGTIGGNAIVNVSASQNISAPGTVFFTVANGNYMETGGGTIGGDAQVNVSASNLSTGALFDDIYNYGGASIGRDAIISLNVSNSFTATGNAEFAIFSSGGTVTRDASINVTAGDISAPSLTAEIDNANGGSIGGNAAININVSGTANVTTDATFEILGSNGVAKGAAINFNGGNYGVGGTFLSTIDGDGAIMFNLASIHANVIKVGVLGNNGTLTIGGGPISANTLLKLYGPFSNGTLNFVANVTLTSGVAADLAANTITIQPSVVVTIRGADGLPANIYTSHPNYNFTPGPGYTGPPGNPSNGTFAGNGARDPQSLTSAPLFGDPPTSSSSSTANASARTNVTASGKVNRGLGGARQKSGDLAVSDGKRTGATINVGSSAQLLSMLDAAAPGPDGKLTVPASNSTRNLRNTKRPNDTSRLNSDPRAVTRHNAQPL